MPLTSSSTDRSGLLAGLACYSVWGLLPLLFHAAQRAGAGAFEIVAWRTVWSVPCALALVLAMDAGKAARALLARPRALTPLLLSAVLIGVNWTLYVWAVNSGRVLSGSLGYYINPILNMAVGALVFRERMGRFGWIACGLATFGVLLQGLALGAFPWVSLALAFSFCGYGIVRKQAEADAQTGLLVECLLLLLPAAIYLLWLTGGGHGVFGRRLEVSGWLLLTGPATVGTLFAFAFAARRLPLATLGFLQFISPTLQFVIGVEGGEALNALRLGSFVFIWAGVAVFAFGAWRRRAGLPESAVPLEA